MEIHQMYPGFHVGQLGMIGKLNFRCKAKKCVGLMVNNKTNLRLNNPIMG